LFGDPSYAWQLLESEMKIEMMEAPEGSDISSLLQLYMVPVSPFRGESKS
jgi:hypothetical protein